MFNDPYEAYLIARYTHWNLYLQQNQSPYLGRCYAAAVREDADFATDMTPSERDELFDVIIPNWKKNLNQVAPFDRENIAIFWNDWNHLHVHLIPRRNASIKYCDHIFTDPRPTGNYSPFAKEELPQDVTASILADMRKVTSKNIQEN